MLVAGFSWLRLVEDGQTLQTIIIMQNHTLNWSTRLVHIYLVASACPSLLNYITGVS